MSASLECALLPLILATALKNVNYLHHPLIIYSANWPPSKSSLIPTLPSPRQHLHTETCRQTSRAAWKRTTCECFQLEPRNTPGSSRHSGRARLFPRKERHGFSEKWIVAVLLVISGVVVTRMHFPKHLSVINTEVFFPCQLPETTTQYWSAQRLEVYPDRWSAQWRGSNSYFQNTASWHSSECD